MGTLKLFVFGGALGVVAFLGIQSFAQESPEMLIRSRTAERMNELVSSGTSAGEIHCPTSATPQESDSDDAAKIDKKERLKVTIKGCSKPHISEHSWEKFRGWLRSDCEQGKHDSQLYAYKLTEEIDYDFPETKHKYWYSCKISAHCETCNKKSESCPNGWEITILKGEVQKLRGPE